MKPHVILSAGVILSEAKDLYRGYMIKEEEV